MLKVTLSTENEITRLVIEGRLVDPEAAELARVWLHARETSPAKAIEADLSSITYADRVGADLLSEMHRRGARLTGNGAMTRALIDAATRSSSPQ
jgi:ABC-type transporter Mla MlaB component